MSVGFGVLVVDLGQLCQRFPLVGLLVLEVLPVAILGGLLYVLWTGQMWLCLGLGCLMALVVLRLGT